MMKTTGRSPWQSLPCLDIVKRFGWPTSFEDVNQLRSKTSTNGLLGNWSVHALAGPQPASHGLRDERVALTERSTASRLRRHRLLPRRVRQGRRARLSDRVESPAA
jgi:hypothetical protein